MLGDFQFIDAIQGKTLENSAMVGQQQYLLNSKHDLSSSETEVYLKVTSSSELPMLKNEIANYFQRDYPNAIVSFAPAINIFERLFTTADPEIVAEYYKKSDEVQYRPEDIEKIHSNIITATNEVPIGVSFLHQLNLDIDKQKMILYGASYNDIYREVKTGFKENNFSVLRSNQQYLPIVLGSSDNEIRDVINKTMINTTTNQDGRRNSIPLSTFVKVTTAEDVKTIIAGKNGEYIPFLFHNVSRPEKMVKILNSNVNEDRNWDVTFSGTFFKNKEMMREMIFILIISILLMYFILAAQFESFVQPFIVLLEIPIDITASLALLMLLGYSLNLMSAIGIVVSCGIIINDSILKVDMMNQLRKSGLSLMDAIHEAGRRRLNSIIMTSLTSIVCMLPLFLSSDMGSELEKPLAVSIIGGMLIGTPISLFVVPLAYWWVHSPKSFGLIFNRRTKKQPIGNE